ncbi:MAG: DUF4432 family protein [Anaerolineae bacterium]
MTTETLVNLTPRMFAEKERVLIEHGPLSASTFLYDSGVCGLRLRSGLGQVVLLPFQGQQIWSAEFRNRNLTMKSMFTEPRPTTDYLSNYGGFLLHCGAATMGVPAQEDTHPLHGELPNAPFQKAWLVVGEDKQGPYLALGGQYQHIVAFNHNYLAEPLLKFYASSTLLDLSMTVTNMKRSDMELMYLAHINFRPVDNGRLVYSAPADPEHMKVRRSIPAHVRTRPGYREWLDELQQHPEKANVLRPELLFDPEVVFTINYLADEDGWAHTMQVHPEGSADYVRHRPSQLDKGVRWICRTPDQDALGMVLPATAEPEGYTAEKAKGNLKILPPGGQFHFNIQMGALTAEEARGVEAKVGRILAR